jgi:hypothetical protein
MKVYPKKLHSVKDLQKEKRKLLREAKRLDGEPMFGAGDSGKSSIGGSVDWMALLPANPVVKMLLKVVERKFLHKQPAPAPANFANTADKEKKISVKGIALEVLGGYLKYKAAELAFKAAKGAIKKRKEKKAEEAAAKAAAEAQGPYRNTHI